MFSFWNLFGDRTFSIIILLLTLSICLAGLLGNSLVLWLLSFRLKRTPLSLYILHLAGADFLFLACQSIFSILTFVQGQQPFYLVVTFLWFTVGLGLLVALSLEQCLAMLCSRWIQWRPQHLSAWVCSSVWALSLPLVLVPSEACGMLLTNSSWFSCSYYHRASVSFLFLLFSGLCTADLVLLVRMQWCFPSRQQPPYYRFTLFVVPLFIFCSLPLLIYWTLMNIIGSILKLLPTFLPIVEFLACVSSCIRAVIFFCDDKHRQELQRVCGRVRKRKLMEALEMKS